ncbi:Inner membrane symporter yihP [uncultured Oscillibacter sp.]|jgi:Na+/melibiose symporter-like transporter|uniref:MFS transporter n=1 Tax=Oscillibacter sp. TaxID=1945593 RepID=UPI000471DB7F|nr:MFS transporter [Oscillibacter sp.]SCH74839.1 Inner membrane symporter yihP [uncultured Oscillibacter sp.]
MNTTDRRQAKFDAVRFDADAKVRLRDKWCMGLVAVSTNGPWVIFSYFLMYFYTDILGMAGTVAGSLMAFARVFDAITDLIMGWAIDHFNLKWGKYRSWVLFSIPTQFVLFIMIFIALPDTTSVAQKVIAYIGYGCFGAIGSTLCFIPTNCQVTNMAKSQTERASIAGIRGVAKNVNKLFIVACYLPIVTFFGGGNEKLGFLISAIVFEGVYISFVIWDFVMSKKYELNADGTYRTHLRNIDVSTGKEIEKISFLQQIKELVRNRPAMVVVVATFILYILDGVRSGATVYLYNNYFERPELASIGLFFNAGCAILGSLCIKWLIKFFKDSNRAYIATMIIDAVMYLVWFGLILVIGRERSGELMGVGQPLFILYALCGFLQGAHLVFPDVMLPMAVDYGQWKFGHNQAGFIFSCYGFCLTIGGALGSALLGILLDAIGYVADTVMAESVLRNLLIVGVALPAILTLVQAVVQAFMGLNDKTHDQYVKEVAARE